VAFRFFRGRTWKKRRKTLDKITKYASLLTIEFREQKKLSQSWAYGLEKLKLKGKVTEEDVKRITVLIHILDSFASAINTSLVFFMRVKAIVDEMKKDYERAKRLKTEHRHLNRHLASKRKVLRSKSKLGKLILKSEIRNLKLECKILKDDLRYVKKEWTVTTSNFKECKKRFKKEHKITKKVISELRRRMKDYRKMVNKIGEDRRYTKFTIALRSHKTRTNLRKFGKWLRRYRWYYRK